MKSKILTGTMALVAGVAIGWFATPTGETTVSSENSGDAQVLNKLAAAGEIIDAEQRGMAVRTAFADANAVEMETLADSVMQLAKRRPDMTIREEFLRRWGELAPRKALAYLGRGAPINDRLTILTAWGRIDPDGASESFRPPEKELSADSRMEARALLAGIAEADPVKAIRFADRFGLDDLTRLEIKFTGFPVNPSFEPSGSYEKFIDRWIWNDPSAAFDVMMTLKSREVREQALNELFHFKWPYHDPEASKAAALGLLKRAESADDDRFPIQSLALIETLAQHLGELDGSLAYQQVIGLRDPAQRLPALKSALGRWKGWGDEQLPEVADFVAMRLKSDTKTSVESELLNHAAELVAGWLTEDGENDEGIANAAEWTMKLPPGEAQDAAISGIVGAWSWLPDQQRKLQEWAIALPPSRQKDIAMAACATMISNQDTARALEMAASIEDAALRAETLAHLGARFIPKEEGGDKVFDVQAWISQNPRIGAELQAAAGKD